MMDCQRTQELISQYLDGGLASSEPRLAAQVDAHLSHCEACQRDLAEMRAMLRVLRSLPPLEPPAYFAHGVQARIARLDQEQKTSLSRWIYPGRVSLTVRLAAAAVALIAIIPPVRQPVVHIGLDILGSTGIVNVDHKGKGDSKTSASTPPASQALGTKTAAMSKDGDKNQAGDKNRAGDKNKEGDTAGSNMSGSAAALPPAADATVEPAVQYAPLLPLVRPPSLPSAHLTFAMDGQLQAGSVVWPTIPILGNRDFTDCTADAYISSGAEFVSDDGQSKIIGVQRRLWSGNMGDSLPTTLAAPFMAAQPGVYDLRVVVHSGDRILTSSDLYIPIGLHAGAVNIQTPPGGSNMYAALSTLAAQANEPVATETGLKGARPMAIQGRSFDEALNSIAAEFGCGAFNRNGIGYVVLHPDDVTRATQAADLSSAHSNAADSTVSSGSNGVNTGTGVPANSAGTSGPVLDGRASLYGRPEVDPSLNAGSAGASDGRASAPFYQTGVRGRP